jgi:hypothetical protein
MLHVFVRVSVSIQPAAPNMQLSQAPNSPDASLYFPRRQVHCPCHGHARHMSTMGSGHTGAALRLFGATLVVCLHPAAVGLLPYVPLPLVVVVDSHCENAFCVVLTNDVLVEGGDDL